MNKILFAARLAKGLSERQVSEKLKINDHMFKEIELGISPTTFDVAETLEKIFNVPFHYFLTPCADNVQTAISSLEKIKEILENAPNVREVSAMAQTHLSLARIGLNALIAEQKQTLLQIQVMELKSENNLLKELYQSVRSTGPNHETPAGM